MVARSALVIPLLLVVPGLAGAQGLELPRQPNTELLFPELPPALPGSMQAVRVFPALAMDEPDNFFVQIVEFPGDGDRLALVEKAGVIRTFDKSDAAVTRATADVYLDLAGQICTDSEEGLYSIAFDPDYLSNGRIYVCYVHDNGRCGQLFPAGDWRLSRFTQTGPTTDTINLATEEVLLEVPQDLFYHKGGTIRFGPDGHLYVGLGESGVQEHAQDLTELRGKILRLDVAGAPDPGLSYAIPPDNPFVGNGSARPEIHSYGYRNPYKMGFHPQTGDLIVGDVGEEGFEEVNIALPGRNYGWPIFEGTTCRLPAQCGTITHEPPVGGFGHGGGLDAIILGPTYTGADVPELHGTTIYADIQGNLYGMKPDGGGGYDFVTLNPSVGFWIAGMGGDNDGEVYLLAAYGSSNGLYVIRPASGPGSNSFPVKLSDMDALFAVGGGIGHTVDGVYPYQPAASLWSDGTTKERYLAVPGLSTIDFAEIDSWGFPEGTVLVKNFLMPLDDRLPEDTLQRIETRLLIRKDGDWHGVTFEWNEEETDATLLADAKLRTFERIDAMGNAYTYQWYYPSRQDCMTCHTSVAGGVLGVNSLQLNNDFLYPASGNVDNQLGALDFVGLFSEPMPVSPNVLPRMVDYHDSQFTLAARARSYLDANCAMCHQPGGPTPATIDLRYLTSDMQSVGFLPNRGTLGIPGAQIIAPGDPWRSVLHARIESTNPAHRMPPLATSLVDEQGAALIADWITSLQLEAAAGGWQHYE